MKRRPWVRRTVQANSIENLIDVEHCNCSFQGGSIRGGNKISNECCFNRQCTCTAKHAKAQESVSGKKVDQKQCYQEKA